MPNYIDPHLQIYIRGECDCDPQANPPILPEVQELRRKVDLGKYTAAQLEALLDVLVTRITTWVGNNPPAE